MPTMPAPFAGAASTDATAVPWSSPSAVTSCSFRRTRSGRPANSGCVTSRPESSTVTGFPGPGGSTWSAPTTATHPALARGGVPAGGGAGRGWGGGGALGGAAPPARDPPCAREERVAGREMAEPAVAPIGLDDADESCADEPGQDPPRSRRAQAPDAEATRDEPPGGEAKRR